LLRAVEELARLPLEGRPVATRSVKTLLGGVIERARQAKGRDRAFLKRSDCAALQVGYFGASAAVLVLLTLATTAGSILIFDRRSLR